jgi:hypothetical protein
MADPKRLAPDDATARLVTLVLGFLGAAGVVAAVALALYRHTFGGPASQDQAVWGQFGDFLGGVLNPFLQFAALFGVVVSLVFTQRQLRLARDQHHEERESADSLFYLEEARRGVERALEMVTKPTNDRVTWILAARTLERSLAIAGLITSPAAQKVWELALESYRIQAGDVLGHANGARSASFFYGSPLTPSGHPEHTDITAAAQFASAGGEVRYLEEASLAAFWRLSEYPAQYPDPLPKTRFTDAQLESPSMHLFTGLRAYLRHRRQFSTHNGVLIPKAPAP